MMHLQRVASLERAPNEYGGEGHCVAVRYGIKLSHEKGRGWIRAAHIHPVMKQYAASGMVDSSGSTSDLRKSWKLLCVPCDGHGSDAEGEEDTGVGRAASAILFAWAGGDVTPEDMIWDGCTSLIPRGEKSMGRRVKWVSTRRGR